MSQTATEAKADRFTCDCCGRSVSTEQYGHRELVRDDRYAGSSTVGEQDVCEGCLDAGCVFELDWGGCAVTSTCLLPEGGER